MATIILLAGPVAATMENLYEDGLDIKVIIRNLVDDLNIEEFWSELRTGSWCLVNPPVQGLPWLASAHQVAEPDEVRPKTQMLIVSPKFHILDGNGLNVYGSNLVGLIVWV
ncbi:sacsin isoform X1 [Olea europaea subsp. europaea]|uniref:Sacsin isoform X1 n=1 Tax=Olea europaea subsp. europaea TaxID=158383 RepID=A0A8S0RII4_OLEEU|nr:sacsin isoform X1 [Olea europaea subsp. europaea]